MSGIYNDDEIAAQARISGCNDAADVIERLLSGLAAVRAERDQLRDAAFDAIQWFYGHGTTIGRANVAERLDAALRGDRRGKG